MDEWEQVTESRWGVIYVALKTEKVYFDFEIFGEGEGLLAYRPVAFFRITAGMTIGLSESGASRTLRELGEAKTAYALLTDRLEDVRKTDVFQVHIHPDYEWYSGQ